MITKTDQLDLNFYLKDLKTLRELATEINYSIEANQAKLEKTELYQSIKQDKERLEEIKTLISETEEEIRLRALIASMEDDYQTRDFSGVKIKKFCTVKVLDETAAKQWAIEFMPEAVSLSKTKFDSGVRNLELNFIEKNIEYRAQIPSKL